MKKQILVIHGGNAFNTYEEYLVYLKNKEVSLDKLRSIDWKRSLQAKLGEDYDVLMPLMPNSQNARYAEWKIYFEKIIPLLNEGVVLTGHSLGGIFLVKYLSENSIPRKIKAVFLVASPYNTATNHPYVDFNISQNLSGFVKQGGRIYFYHSKDDNIVPYSNMLDYQTELPDSNYRIFEDRGHFNVAEFPEIIEDIKSLWIEKL